MAIILDGAKLSAEIKQNIKQEVEIIKKNNQILPKLVVVLVGEDAASKVYVANKEKACKAAGILSQVYNLPTSTTQTQLDNLIKKLNKDKSVNGILLQLPLPAHLNSYQTINLIDSTKDVDGLTVVNMGKLLAGDESGFVPCTPLGVMTILQKYNLNLAGASVAMIGKSLLVGTPLALLLSKKGATVTLCHSLTKNLKTITTQSDIIITAVGKQNLLTKDMVNKNAVVIDVGINRNSQNRIVGDADFENIKDIASYITPVPGGVGPMTIAMLLQNLLFAWQQTTH